MRINAVCNNCYVDYKNNNNNNFKGLIKDKSVLPIIQNMSQADKIEFNKIEERLSKSKFWDLKISSIGNKFEEFKFHFIDKNHKHGVITDGIYPYGKEDDTIKIYSIVYGPQNISKNLVEELKYASKERADEVYNAYEQNHEMMINKQFRLTPIESLKSKEIELNMLDEGFQPVAENPEAAHVNTESLTKNFIGNDYKL